MCEVHGTAVILTYICRGNSFFDYIMDCVNAIYADHAQELSSSWFKRAQMLENQRTFWLLKVEPWPLVSACRLPMPLLNPTPTRKSSCVHCLTNSQRARPKWTRACIWDPDQV